LLLIRTPQTDQVNASVVLAARYYCKDLFLRFHRPMYTISRLTAIQQMVFTLPVFYAFAAFGPAYIEDKWPHFTDQAASRYDPLSLGGVSPYMCNAFIEYCQ
jgi:hypothetical protein